MILLRKTAFISISITAGFLVAVVLLELLLGFMPVTGNIEYSVVTQAAPYLHHQPYAPLQTSLGWNFYNVVTTRANNYGYISSADYSKNGKPAIAVIGDSYVEALQVEKERGLTEILGNSLMENVYSVAISGSALSQYVAFIKFAELEFDPKVFVIVVVGNDFDESLCSVRPKPGHHCYQRHNGEFKLSLRESHSIGWIRRVAKSSALMRYLVFNLQIDWRKLASLANLLSDDVADVRYAGNTAFVKSPQIEHESRAAVGQFFYDIRAIIGAKPVLFIVDADREAIYTGSDGQNSFFSKMRNYFIEQAREHNYEVIDMWSIFANHYSVHKAKFEFPTDGHWNELGHRLAADAILHSDIVRKVKGGAARGAAGL